MIQFLFALFGAIISTWWLWLPIGGWFGYLAWQNYRRLEWAKNTEHQLLLLEIPRTNEKKELAAEQLFSSLHGILRPRKELLKEGAIQEHISFEIAAIDQRIRFYVWTPKHLVNFVEGQIYAQYPEVQIEELDEDYARQKIEQPFFHSGEITLTADDTVPIRTFPSFEVDPLAGLTATLAKLENKNEQIWIQIMAQPIDDSWHQQGARKISSIKKGGGGFSGKFGGMLGSIFQFGGQIISALFKPPEAIDTAAPELSERQRSQITAIEEKSRKLGYRVRIRIAYIGNDQQTAKVRLQALVGSLKQFNSTNLNGFQLKNTSFDIEDQKLFHSRYMHKGGFTLNTEELASIWHLPHTNVETPNILWAHTRVAEPPSNLPTLANSPETSLSLFGATNFRGDRLQFGLNRTDRGRHVYIIGQTGTGKSGLLQLLTMSDVYHNKGFAVIDPHGDYAQAILSYIPEHRLDQVVYFNPADTEFPMAFNPLEVFDENLKNHVASELVGVLKRMFDSWGPRLEYILRYTILALLDYPDSTMIDITRMLTEKDFRNDVISHVKDPVVRQFWVAEFGSWDMKFQTEAVAPVLNKVGAFTANPLVRNIVGQSKSSFNIRRIMDDGHILIVNLSRGLVGEDNAAVLGSLLVTKIQLAAMSRADIPMEQRRPFYLYVDEFQNFATDSFAVILSEARKYGLNLTVANQYTSQMVPEVADAIFGNVGSLVSFRVGADDARLLEKYVEPQFESSDLLNMTNRHFVGSLSIHGERAHPFSATTLTIPPTQANHTPRIVELSRQKYTQPKHVIEDDIAEAAAFKSKKQRQHHNQNKKRTHSTSKKSQQNQEVAKRDKKDDSPSNDQIQENQTVSLR